MNTNLINLTSQTINNETVQAVSARELHQFLGSKQDFSTWIKARIEAYSFVENQDFITFHKIVERAKLVEYAITIDMAKELSMVERTPKGKQARQYFIECERQLNQPKLPTTYLEALRELIKKEEEVQKLNTLIDNEFGYCSILRAATYAGVHEKEFNWRPLKRTTLGLNLPVKKVPSPRYGYQNLYPIKAFEMCYPDIDFDDLKPEHVADKAELALTHGVC